MDPSELPDLELVRSAAERCASEVVRTPFSRSRTLGEILGTEIHVKFENLQFTGSFKDRGAVAKLTTLGPEQRRRGVVALSAGNHAQGVAHQAAHLGIPATIVMPTTTPYVKVRQTEHMGASVVQIGDTISDGLSKVEELVSEGLTLVHPYDDPIVIAGQGTVALEILEQGPEPEVLVAPVGGGGLLAGIATVMAELAPSVELIGVQAAGFDNMVRRLAGQELRNTPTGDTLADGMAVKDPGEITSKVLERHVTRMLTVTEESLEQAVNLYLDIEKTVAEGAGAASLAAVVEHPEVFAGRRTALILSGGNIDSRVLASVIMRGLVRKGLISRLRIATDDLPGRLADVTRLISDAGANIVEIQHQRLLPELSGRRVDIDVLLESRHDDHAADVIALLRSAGLEVSELEV